MSFVHWSKPDPNWRDKARLEDLFPGRVTDHGDHYHINGYAAEWRQVYEAPASADTSEYTINVRLDWSDWPRNPDGTLWRCPIKFTEAP